MRIRRRSRHPHVYRDALIFLYHAAIAYLIKAWVRGEDLGLLHRRFVCCLVGCLCASAVLTAVPVSEQNLGLWPHSDCFVRRSWVSSRRPSNAILVDRMLLLPASWLFIVVQNATTIYRLRKDYSRTQLSSSGRPLQVSRPDEAGRGPLCVGLTTDSSCRVRRAGAAAGRDHHLRRGVGPAVRAPLPGPPLLLDRVLPQGELTPTPPPGSGPTRQQHPRPLSLSAVGLRHRHL
jgi:hypothetical protein